MLRLNPGGKFLHLINDSAVNRQEAFGRQLFGRIVNLLDDRSDRDKLVSWDHLSSIDPFMLPMNLTSRPVDDWRREVVPMTKPLPNGPFAKDNFTSSII